MLQRFNNQTFKYIGRALHHKYSPGLYISVAASLTASSPSPLLRFNSSSPASAVSATVMSWNSTAPIGVTIGLSCLRAASFPETVQAKKHDYLPGNTVSFHSKKMIKVLSGVMCT